MIRTCICSTDWVNLLSLHWPNGRLSDRPFCFLQNLQLMHFHFRWWGGERLGQNKFWPFWKFSLKLQLWWNEWAKAKVNRGKRDRYNNKHLYPPMDDSMSMYNFTCVYRLHTIQGMYSWAVHNDLCYIFTIAQRQMINETVVRILRKIGEIGGFLELKKSTIWQSSRNWRMSLLLLLLLPTATKYREDTLEKVTSLVSLQVTSLEFLLKLVKLYKAVFTPIL